MAEWLTSMLRAKGPLTKISGNEEMTACRWPPSITILQLPQEETEGAQSALIKWQFTRCKSLRILGRAFHKALPWPMRPRRAPAEFERRHRIISVFFGFDPEFVEERSLHLLFWLASSDARRCSVSISIQRFLLQYSSVIFDLILRFPVVAHCCLLSCVCEDLLASMCGRLFSSACKHVFAGCFHLQWHSFSFCFYGWSLSAPLSSSCLRFPALSQIRTTNGKITCTATRNKPTCSKPEKSQ